MDYYPREKAEAEFMDLTKDMRCGKRWLGSQQVYCALEIDHPGMCESDAVSDSGEDCHLWWGGIWMDKGERT